MKELIAKKIASARKNRSRMITGNKFNWCCDPDFHKWEECDWSC
jgi:hypothetical protein